MHMIFRFSKNALLLLAALLTPTVIATAEDDRKSLAQKTGWVESHEAGYSDAGGEVIGDEVANTKHAEISVKALPEERLTILKTQEEWKAFVERYARIDKASGKPVFVSASGFVADSKRTEFKPDFDSEAVVILSVDKAQKEGVRGFMDIEVFEDEDRLRAFVFFGSQTGKPVVVGEEAVAGRAYMVSVPRKLATLPVEVRMARQSWGRVCSKFSPPITNFDDAERQPADRVEQDEKAK